MTRVPLGVSARPFDFYVAFLVFFAGAYTFIDPNWPPKDGGELQYWLIMIEDIYLMIAGACIMLALIIKQIGLSSKRGVSDKAVVAAVVGEMFGWLFVSASSAVIAVTAWIFPPIAIQNHLSKEMAGAWFLMWAGLAISSFARWRDMRNVYKGPRK